MYSFIQAHIPVDTASKAHFRNAYMINFYRSEQFIYKIQETLGIIDPVVTKESNFSVRHKNLLEQKSDEIDLGSSHFSKDLQFSKYITIEDDIDKLQETFRIKSSA